MQDDAALLIRYSQDGSNEAFTELVRRHIDFVYSSALRQVAGDAHLAEEVAQSVFADLARKAGSLTDHPVLARWLHTAAHHAASKAVRSEQRRRDREKIAQAVQELSNDPAHDAEWARIRPWLDESLRELGHADGDALLLRFFEASSFASIGGKLGLSENAARMRVERALGKLQILLSRRGITSTTAALAALLSDEAVGAAPSGLAATVTHAALGSAATGGGAIAAILPFMSTAKLTLGVVGFVAIAAIVGTLATGFGIYEIKEARLLEAALLTAQREFAAKRASLRAAQQSALSDAKSLAELRQAANSQASLSTSQRPTAANPKTSLTSGQSGKEELGKFLAAFPEARGILSGLFKLETATAYGPFFKSVEMSPHEVDAFEDAVVAARLANLALKPSGFSGTDGPPLPDDQLRATLGEPRYHQFEDFIQVQPAFGFANFAAAAAGTAGAPLSTDQEDQLVRILVENTPVSQKGAPIDLSDVNWDAVLPQAQAVVSAAQWNALQGEILRMQYGQALQAARGAGTAAGSSPSR